MELTRQAVERMIVEILQEKLGDGEAYGVRKAAVPWIHIAPEDRMDTGNAGDRVYTRDLFTLEESPRLEEPEQYREVFYDLLSETCSYLEEKEFQTEVHIDWEERRIRTDRTYVARILDNITSNIVKYAGKNEPVVICCDVSCGAVRLTFVNGIGIPEGTVESTRIGLVNVKNMMERMGGTCRTEQSRERFSLTLLFPCI